MDKFQNILSQYWGYADFRGIQHEIISSIASGHDTLGLMPTGGGKSITFQVPALAQEGICIVITPLIALMKDQVTHLREKGIKAAAIYSGMTRQEIIVTLENCIFGGVKLLYISPERLSSPIFQAKLRHLNVSFITVDEAHCISQWGYDFRPSYLRIADIRLSKPGVPVLALTATATPHVVDDIQKQLGFQRKNVFKMSFERKNLAYVVRKVQDKEDEIIHILRAVEGSAIVYVRSRRHAKDLAQLLNANHLCATFYHGGLDPAVKDQRQDDWQTDRTRIIVATNAFGMGIDKPDVRTVIHYDCPDSLEAYFQEAGRAGRDGQKAYAVMLYNNGDRRKLEKRIVDNFPDKDYIRQVYAHLAYYYQIGAGSGGGYTFEFNIDKFCQLFKHFPIQVDAALKILERAGYIEYERDPNAASRVMFLLNRHELYRLDETAPHEEAVITALLRNYGGLFTDYANIDEALIAMQSGLTEQQVYLNLKALSHKRILHFIPKRKSPYLTYTRDREETERILLPPAVYEDRRTQFVERIRAVEEYACNDETCRCRQLLRYFGEERTADCGQCDVCLDHQTDHHAPAATAHAKAMIRDLLADRSTHFITELKSLPIPGAQLDIALEQLIDEEEISISGSELSLN